MCVNLVTCPISCISAGGSPGGMVLGARESAASKPRHTRRTFAQPMTPKLIMLAHLCYLKPGLMTSLPLPLPTLRLMLEQTFLHGTLLHECMIAVGH